MSKSLTALHIEADMALDRASAALEKAGNPNHDEKGRFSFGSGSGGTSADGTNRSIAGEEKRLSVKATSYLKDLVANHGRSLMTGLSGHGSNTFEAAKRILRQRMIGDMSRSNEDYSGQRERNHGVDRGGRKSLKQYYTGAVKTAVLRYSNNRAPQKEVKAALLAAGAPAEQVKAINWSKSYFPQREFES